MEGKTTKHARTVHEVTTIRGWLLYKMWLLIGKGKFMIQVAINIGEFEIFSKYKSTKQLPKC